MQFLRAITAEFAIVSRLRNKDQYQSYCRLLFLRSFEFARWILWIVLYACVADHDSVLANVSSELRDRVVSHFSLYFSSSFDVLLDNGEPSKLFLSFLYREFKLLDFQLWFSLFYSHLVRSDIVANCAPRVER